MHDTNPQVKKHLSSLKLPQNNISSFINLNDYILQDKIGTGSFGKVYRVKENQTKKIYAAKISIKALDESTQDLFMDISREVNIISKLNHPSILKFILFSPINFKKKPKPVIITEFAPNGTLSDLITHDQIYPNDHLLTDTIKLKIIYGIVSAMSYLHSHGILHRDLKPDNILIDEFLFPKVADFGLSKSDISDAKSIVMRTVAGTLKGTPMYMAPEIWRSCEYSKASDVYAFAILLYEVVTCKRPFPSTDIYSLMVRVQSGFRPQFGGAVGESYKRLIVRCWSGDAASRPSFEEIAAELRTERGFITDGVDEGEFRGYVRFLDEYKATFDAAKVVVRAGEFGSIKLLLERARMEEKKRAAAGEERLIRLIEGFPSTTQFRFPYARMRQLSEEARAQVEGAEGGDAEMQFEVGRSLVEGRRGFPIDAKLGIIFLKRAIGGGSSDALAYLVLMLASGRIVPPNAKKARKLLDKNRFCEESLRAFLSGRLLKSEKRYEEAASEFKRAMNLGSVDSFYEFAQLVRKKRVGSTTSADKEGEGGNWEPLYRAAIEKGSARAMRKLGLLLNKEGESEEGARLIKDAADSGDAKAMYEYGLLIEKVEKESKIAKSDSNESMIYFKRSADEGCVEAMNRYGVNLLKYVQSMLKEVSKDEAIAYIKKASDKGNFESMHEYGFLLLRGNGIAQDVKEGARYIKIAADNGHADAIGEYASLLLEGQGVEVNYEKAFEYYKKAIAKGSALAMNDYGYILKYGKGVEVNYTEAIKYYKMAIEKGSVPALNNYAMMLQHGQGCDVNYPEAMKYYKMAIDRGRFSAMHNYAFMLQHGQGCKVNYPEAMKYYKLAIDKGVPNSMDYYATMLRKGQGCEVNYEEAVKYYIMAIAKGFAPSMVNYADMLAKGEGVPVDREAAARYYRMAADKYNAEGMLKYGRMLRESESEEKKEEGVMYIKRAADFGCVEAMCEFARIMESQLDRNEAVKYFEKAAEKGNEEARKELQKYQ